MRIFKHKNFHRWAKSHRLTEAALKKAVHEIEQNLFEAHLGCGLYKKRIAMPGKGKRGSYRTLVAFKNNERAIFIYGYMKNERDDIDENEKWVYKSLAKDLLTASEKFIEIMLCGKKLIEVK